MRFLSKFTIKKRYVKSCTNEIIIQVLSEILGLEDEDEG